MVRLYFLGGELGCNKKLWVKEELDKVDKKGYHFFKSS